MHHNIGLLVHLQTITKMCSIWIVIGRVNRGGCGDDSDDTGFRPIVCLNSNVKLQDNGDGTYTIK